MFETSQARLKRTTRDWHDTTITGPMLQECRRGHGGEKTGVPCTVYRTLPNARKLKCTRSRSQVPYFQKTDRILDIYFVPMAVLPLKVDVD